jgi:sugar phosphate permease
VILAAGTLAQASFATVSIGLPALAPALRVHYRLSLGETGVVLAAIGIGMLFTLFPWGVLADRLDERSVIAVGLAAAGAATAAAGTTRSYASLSTLLIVAGAFGASVNAASGRAVMGWFEADELGLALGIRQTAIPIGGAVGAAALPWLASAGGTRLAFHALGGCCGAGALVAAAFMRGAPRREADPDGGTHPLREPRMWLLAGGTALYLTAQIAVTGFVVLFLHEHRHVTTHAAAGLLAGINALAIGARIAAGRVSDRLRTRLRPLRVIGLSLGLATLAVAVLLDEPLTLLAPAFVVAGVLGMTWNGLAFAAAAEAAGASRTGAALGFQQTLLGVVVAAAPPAFAAIAGVSWRLAYALSALGPLLGVLALSRLPEASRRFARTPGTSAIPPAAR